MHVECIMIYYGTPRPRAKERTIMQFECIMVRQDQEQNAYAYGSKKKKIQISTHTSYIPCSLVLGGTIMYVLNALWFVVLHRRCAYLTSHTQASC